MTRMPDLTGFVVTFMSRSKAQDLSISSVVTLVDVQIGYIDIKSKKPSKLTENDALCSTSVDVSKYINNLTCAFLM